MKVYHISYTYLNASQERRRALGALILGDNQIRFKTLSRRFLFTALLEALKDRQIADLWKKYPQFATNLHIRTGLSGAQDIIFRSAERDEFYDYPLLAHVHVTGSGYVEYFELPMSLVPPLLGAFRYEISRNRLSEYFKDIKVFSPVERQNNIGEFMRRLDDFIEMEEVEPYEHPEGTLWTKAPKECERANIEDFDCWPGRSGVIVRASAEQCEMYFHGEFPLGVLVPKE